MIDSYYIGAYWGPRAESLSQVRDKIVQTLERLMLVDEQFSSWYEGGMSRKKALEKKVIMNNETIERICLEMVRKGELDKNGFSPMGFLFGLWTGHHDDKSSSISFKVGTDNERLSNSCVLNIPYEGAARERLLRPEKVKLILSILVEMWHPDYAMLTSHELGDKLTDLNEIGWITYRKSIQYLPKISDKIMYEKLGEGHLFTVAHGNYNLNNVTDELLELKKII